MNYIPHSETPPSSPQPPTSKTMRFTRFIQQKTLGMALIREARGLFSVLVVTAILLLEAPSCHSRLPVQPRKGSVNQLILTADCGKTKGCFSKPKSCSSSNDCDYLMTYKPSESAITFELSSKAKWVAVGFNLEPIMDGTDSIICSVMENATATVGHYPVKGHDTPQKTMPDPKGLEVTSVSYGNGGIIKCRFTRQNTDTIMEGNLNNKVYVIFAYGSIESGELLEHDWKAHSMAPESLRKIQILEATELDLFLIQIHGVLMVIAWVGFATTGMFIARFMRSAWGQKQMCGKNVWFQVHRLIMVITVSLTLVATILAFIYVGGWSEDAGAHPVVGVIVLSMAIIQPVVAVLRPHPDGQRRSLFNFTHRTFGLIVLALAVTNIFLGSVLPAFHLDNSAVYVMIVYLLGLAAVVLFDIYLACVQASGLTNYRVLSKPQEDEVELAPGTNRTQGDHHLSFKLHNIMFGALILLVCVTCLAMLVLITEHE